jgi:hypothetical protein
MVPMRFFDDLDNCLGRCRRALTDAPSDNGIGSSSSRHHGLKERHRPKS